MKKDIRKENKERDIVISGIMEGLSIGIQNVGFYIKSHQVASLEENVELGGACFTIHIHIEKIGTWMKESRIGIIWEKVKEIRIITREKVV